MSGIYVVGDLHGMWRGLNNFINKKNPDIILQCGDFGWWPEIHGTTGIQEHVPVRDFSGVYGGVRKLKKWDQFGIKNKNCTVYWADGNHENHHSLIKLKGNQGRRPIEVMPNVFYMPRGTVLTLPSGENVMFFGGAKSVDKMYRTPSVDWFAEETIATSELFQLPEMRIDIIVSHTCPREIFNDNQDLSILKDASDPCMNALSVLLEEYKPSKWFFAHFHTFKHGIHNNTSWWCLNQEGETGWWRRLS